ncbi:MAG: hypothetical protein KBA33_08050 [Cloacibacterium sp.]|nr:hypothetical protein [Cloacibacterium sp.]
MFKNLFEIIAEIMGLKEANPHLKPIDTTSKVSIWRQFIEVVSFAHWNMQNVVELHGKEIETKIQEQKIPGLKWYRNQALRYQHGFSVIEDTEFFKTTLQKEIDGVLTDVPATEDETEASKKIKYCSVNKPKGSRDIIIKIATEENNEIVPVPQEVQDGVEYWFENHIQAAGDNLVFINFKPDILNLSIEIFVNPTIINLSGMNNAAKYPVQDVIKTHLKALPFNGELDVQKFVDKLQKIEGVEKLKINKIESKWIVPSGGDAEGYGISQPIAVAKIPESGHFKITDFSGITYKVWEDD